jgi:hypothetical protein
MGCWRSLLREAGGEKVKAFRSKIKVLNPLIGTRKIILIQLFISELGSIFLKFHIFSQRDRTRGLRAWRSADS